MIDYTMTLIISLPSPIIAEIVGFVRVVRDNNPFKKGANHEFQS
jgi:hypothetical protein